jgi:hypothetical protein
MCYRITLPCPSLAFLQPVSRHRALASRLQGEKPELESLDIVLDARNIARSRELGCLCWRERPE